MQTSPVPVAVVGATGYAGEGTIKLLLGHPHVTIVHAGSDRLAGERLADAVPSFAGSTDLVLQPDDVPTIQASGARVVILCKKSPDITAIVPDLKAAGIVLIDVGPEFRLRSHDDYRRWYGEGHECPELLPEAVYGLCEWHTDAIKTATVIGNPGCYATGILLPLLPLFRKGLVDSSAPLVSVSYSGLSGAGKRFNEGNNNLFYAMNENLHSYKALAHQHIGEVDQELSAAAGEAVHCHFIPHLAPITRGIHSTISLRLRPGTSLDAALSTWREAYADRPFVRIRETLQQVEVANTTATNFCDIAAQLEGDTLIIASAEDNLVKGASGQAIQNMNLVCGFDETTGLLHRTC